MADHSVCHQDINRLLTEIGWLREVLTDHCCDDEMCRCQTMLAYSVEPITPISSTGETRGA